MSFCSPPPPPTAPPACGTSKPSRSSPKVRFFAAMRDASGADVVIHCLAAPPASSGLRGAQFTPDGSALLCASGEGVQCHGWEPARVHDAVALPWRAPADLACRDGRLLGAALHTASVAVWVLDLARMAPFASPAAAAAEAAAEAAATTPEKLRRSADAAAAADAADVARSMARLSAGTDRLEPAPAEGDDSPEMMSPPPQRLSDMLQRRASASAGADAVLSPQPVPQAAPPPAPVARASVSAAARPSSAAAAPPGGEEVAAMLAGHADVANALASRLTHLGALGSAWRRGDARAASAVLSRASAAGDSAALADALHACLLAGTAATSSRAAAAGASQRRDDLGPPGTGLLTLPGAAALLPHLPPLLDSPSERHAEAAVAAAEAFAVRHFVRRFSLCFGFVSPVQSTACLTRFPATGGAGRSGARGCCGRRQHRGGALRACCRRLCSPAPRGGGAGGAARPAGGARAGSGAGAPRRRASRSRNSARVKQPTRNTQPALRALRSRCRGCTLQAARAR